MILFKSPCRLEEIWKFSHLKYKDQNNKEWDNSFNNSQDVEFNISIYIPIASMEPGKNNGIISGQIATSAEGMIIYALCLDLKCNFSALYPGAFSICKLTFPMLFKQQTPQCSGYITCILTSSLDSLVNFYIFACLSMTEILNRETKKYTEVVTLFIIIYYHKKRNHWIIFVQIYAFVYNQNISAFHEKHYTNTSV